MHRCLQIQETLSIIFSNILEVPDSYAGRRIWPFEGSQTLANLAITCKAFVDPALNLLWHYVPDLRLLIVCLPEDAWKEGRTKGGRIEDSYLALTLTRDLTPSDFENRFAFYAKRIKVFGAAEGYFQRLGKRKVPPCMSNLVLPALLTAKPGPGRLLPNVSTNVMSYYDFDGFGWLPKAILSPGVRTINVMVEYEAYNDDWYNEDDVNVTWRNFNKCLSVAKASLQDIHIWYQWDEASKYEIRDFWESPGLSTLLTALEKPQVLRLINFEMTSEALAHLSSLESLSHLEVTMTTEETEKYLQGGLAAPGCRLSSLVIRTYDLALCSQLLQKLASSSLRHLKIIRHMDSDDKWELDAFLQSATTGNFLKDLVTFELVRRLHTRDPDPLISEITSETIGYLLLLQDLEVLRLSLNTQVKIDLATLHRMADAWPKLRILDLREQSTQRIPAIGLIDVLLFAKTLPLLHEFRIRFDATKNMELSDFEHVVRCPSLLTLDVCTSPIMEWSDGVAEMLMATCTSIRELSYGWEYGDEYDAEIPTDDYPTQELRYLARWEGVEKGLSCVMQARGRIDANLGEARV